MNPQQDQQADGLFRKESQEELEKAEEPSDEPMSTQKRPKNLQQGLLFGASNILGAASRGVGVAIYSPVAGAKAGAEKGGLGGAAVGLVGGAALG
jgi:hypothetical protein